MKRKYDISIVIFLIILTVLLTRDHGLMETNFSVLGSRGGRRIGFLLWGALVGSMTYLGIADIADRAGCRDGVLDGFLCLSLYVFLCGIGLPYRSKLLPGMARLHVYLSMGGVLLLVCAICRLLWLLERQYGTEFRMEKYLLILMQIPAAALYLYAGIISVLLELYAVCTGWAYLYVLQRKIENLGLSKGGNM